MKPVMLNIRGEQRYEGQDPETIELVTEGLMIDTEDGWRISYEESDLTGLKGSTTVFEVHPSQIILTRTGSLQSRMVFEEGLKHNSLYQMDVGALMLSVCAQKIQWELDWDGGFLDVLYHVQIEETAVGTVHYHIAVTPGKKK